MSNFKETFNGFRDLAKYLASVDSFEVLVGVPESETQREEDIITNAALAYIHDTGSPEAGIPARPFMTEGIKDAQDVITEGLQKVGARLMQGDKTGARRESEKVGLKAQVSIQKKIRDNDFDPLAESTLAARRARGVKRTKPLIDTGALLQSITYVVKEDAKS